MRLVVSQHLDHASPLPIYAAAQHELRSLLGTPIAESVASWEFHLGSERTSVSLFPQPGTGLPVVRMASRGSRSTTTRTVIVDTPASLQEILGDVQALLEQRPTETPQPPAA